MNTPSLSPRLGRVGRSVFSQLLHRLSQYQGKIYPLHVGDTYLEPAVSLDDPELKEERASLSHRYTPVRGAPSVIEAARSWLSERQGMEVSPDEVIITGGGTAGLSALLAALLSPGDEVLLLAPYWPLMAGATRLHGAHPIAVPIFQEGLSLDQALHRLDQHCTDKARILYINTPNNPTGDVLSAEWVEAMVTWAERRGLWVISDEVYDLFNYQGDHCYARPLDPSRVISAFSMSKAFGMAGYRCGILQGPPDVLTATERVLTHAIYSAATPGQLAARTALGPRGLEWARHASREYQRVGQECARRLGVAAPQGSTFLFLDVSEALGPKSRYHSEDGGVSALLETCVDHGLLLAPGNAFGPYPHHLRLCFTSATPEVVLEGVDLLKGILSSS
jgi:N-succinyldiaminopimelate aminotransferase